MNFKKPEFWDNSKLSIWSIILYPFSLIYLFICIHTHAFVHVSRLHESFAWRKTTMMRMSEAAEVQAKERAKDAKQIALEVKSLRSTMLNKFEGLSPQREKHQHEFHIRMHSVG